MSDIERLLRIYGLDHYTAAFEDHGVTSAADVGSLRLHDLTALGIQGLPDAKRFHRLIRATAAQSLAQNNTSNGGNSGHAVAPTEQTFRKRHGGRKQEGDSMATAQVRRPEDAARWQTTPVLPPIGHTATVATHQPIEHRNHQFLHQQDRRKKWARSSHNENGGESQPIKAHAEHQRSSPSSMDGATAFSTLEREATIVLSQPAVLVSRPAPPLARDGASMAARQRIARRKHGNNCVDKSTAHERHASSVAVPPSDVPVGDARATELERAEVAADERRIKKKREPRPEWISDFAVAADTHTHNTSSFPLNDANNDHATSLTDAAPNGSCTVSPSPAERPLPSPSLIAPDIDMTDRGLPIASRHSHRPADVPHTVLAPSEHPVSSLHSQHDAPLQWPNVPPRHDGAVRHHGRVPLLKRTHHVLDVAQDSDSSSCGAVPTMRRTNHHHIHHIHHHNNINYTCDGNTTALAGMQVKGFGSMNGQSLGKSINNKQFLDSLQSTEYTSPATGGPSRVTTMHLHDDPIKRNTHGHQRSVWGDSHTRASPAIHHEFSGTSPRRITPRKQWQRHERRVPSPSPTWGVIGVPSRRDGATDASMDVLIPKIQPVDDRGSDGDTTHDEFGPPPPRESHSHIRTNHAHHAHRHHRRHEQQQRQQQQHHEVNTHRPDEGRVNRQESPSSSDVNTSSLNQTHQSHGRHDGPLTTDHKDDAETRQVTSGQTNLSSPPDSSDRGTLLSPLLAVDPTTGRRLTRVERARLEAMQAFGGLGLDEVTKHRTQRKIKGVMTMKDREPQHRPSDSSHSDAQRAN